MKIILNIAAGKLFPIDLDNLYTGEEYFLINNDVMYYNNLDPIEIEENLENQDINTIKQNSIHYCKTDTFEFMERTKILFDRITIYRFLEHVPMDRVEYFIYLLSTVTKPGSIIDVIVPDYDVLAKMILKEKINKNFHANNILLTTELLNQPPDSHSSLWTEKRAKYFFELEGRFKVINNFKRFKFDGRDIYLRFLAERIEN